MPMPNRRAFLQTLMGGATFLPHLGARAAGRKPARNPNVLFISVDDINDWIGVLGGHPDTQTPNMDRLAQRGTLFTRAYCSAPSCNPSRVSLMTGLRPTTTGIHSNTQRYQESIPQALTLPAYFMSQGYRALGAGKLFHHPDEGIWDASIPVRFFPNPQDPPLNGIPNAENFDWGALPLDDQGMGDTGAVDWVIDQLGQSHDVPFFLACGLYKPHLPWYGPQRYFDQFPPDQITLPPVLENDLDDLPAAAREAALQNDDHQRVIATMNWRPAVAAYLAMIAYADGQIGRLLDALDASPHRDTTIIVLFSDHGWHLGEKFHWRKFALWEEATRIPLMIVAPGLTTPGSVCHRPVSLLDLFPTLADLCSLPRLPYLEGQSLVPLLSDPSLPWDLPAITTWGLTNHSVRTERWRYIRYSDGSEELYDHDHDPLEWYNLAFGGGQAEVRHTLAAWLPDREDAPEIRAVQSAYPNPFSDTTTIEFILPEAADVNLVLYDVRGRVVRTLSQPGLDVGRHQVTWDGREEGGQPAASGMYICRLVAGPLVESRRLVLLR
jgi:arylsulfatase A-like enzyme